MPTLFDTMQDERLDKILRDWANTQLPDDATRDTILHSVLVHSQPAGLRPPLLRFRRIAAALLGIGVVAATLLFMVTLLPEQFIDIPIVQNVQNVQNDDDSKIRISLIVLKQLPDSDTAVEFLEDAVFVAEKQQLHEIELGGHCLYFWICPLETTLFSLDMGIDNASETGIVAVPDRPQALQFQSNGDNFDVFVSVLPFS